MKGAGRKNLKRATEETHVSLEDGQSIAQVISLRGSNLIEVMDARGEKSIALFPAKFQKSIWMKRGSFVVIDGNAKQKDKDKGSKVSYMISRVLFHEQVRMLQKTSEWPEIFKPTDADSSEVISHTSSYRQENEVDVSDDDDGLPPLEANTNRLKPFNLHSDAESSPSTDSDS